MSQRRLLASLPAPFLKDKKGVRFSVLYLQKKRNLLVLDHSHQQVSYFSMLVQSLNGSTWIRWKVRKRARDIPGVPDESAIISGASSKGTGSKPGDPDEEKLIH
ncbi:hypothetical protein Tco_1350408, partial [Tanacetum coccineum]